MTSMKTTDRSTALFIEKQLTRRGRSVNLTQSGRVGERVYLIRSDATDAELMEMREANFSRMNREAGR